MCLAWLEKTGREQEQYTSQKGQENEQERSKTKPTTLEFESIQSLQTTLPRRGSVVVQRFNSQRRDFNSFVDQGCRGLTQRWHSITGAVPPFLASSFVDCSSSCCCSLFCCCCCSIHFQLISKFLLISIDFHVQFKVIFN